MSDQQSSFQSFSLGDYSEEFDYLSVLDSEGGQKGQAQQTVQKTEVQQPKREKIHQNQETQSKDQQVSSKLLSLEFNESQSYKLQFDNQRECKLSQLQRERFVQFLPSQARSFRYDSVVAFSETRQPNINSMTLPNKLKMRKPRIPRHTITPALVDKLAAKLQTHQNLKAAGKGHLLPLRAIASEFHLSPAILSDFYQQSLKDPLLTGKKLACTRELMLVGQNQKMNFIDRRIQALHKVIAINCRLTMKQMSPLIFRIQKQQPDNLETEPLSKYGVRRIVKKAGYKRKFIKRNLPLLNTYEAIAMREIYAKNFVGLLKQSNNQIYFVAVERFHIFMHRLRGWALKGDDPSTQIKDNRHIINLFCGVSKQKILFHEIQKGANKKQTFFCQLAQFLESILQKGQQQSTHYIVFDSIYSSQKKEIDEYLWKYEGFYALYLPVGSQTLNPIEKIFRKLRNQVFQARIKRNQILIQYLGERMKEFQVGDFGSYYREIGTHLELSLKRKPLS